MKRVVAIALVAILVAAAWWVAGDRARVATERTAGATSDPAGEISTPEGAAAVARAPAVSPAVVPAPPGTPLPAADVPLRDSFATLDALARAGDAHASCRAAAELRRCSYANEIARRRSTLDERLASLAAQLERSQKQPQEIERIERQMQRVEDEEARQRGLIEHCAGSEPENKPSPSRYLLLPALRGHAPSRALYLGYLPTRELLRDPGLGTDYLANAPRLMRQGIEAGDLRIVILWMLAINNPDITPLSAALPTEWRSVGLVNELVERVREHHGDGVPPLLQPFDVDTPSTPEDRAEAQRIFEAHFRHNRTPPKLDDIVGLFGGIELDAFGCETLVAP